MSLREQDVHLFRESSPANLFYKSTADRYGPNLFQTISLIQKVHLRDIHLLNHDE